MRTTQGNSGFTLLELIIVMLLMSIILGIAVVGFATRLPSARFSATVRELTATIRHARALAQITGEKQRLAINTDTGTYGIAGKGGKTISPDVRMKVIDDISGEVVNGQYEMVFYPAGNSSGGTVMLWNEKRKAEVALDPVVGAVSIK